ncbi:hypothetical protein AWV79_22700 [Cupriavidus sp. UYMMa02A]|nr:hypothetical protein AWV79_22700 [Cupriavidus sp. UYMMa02A]
MVLPGVLNIYFYRDWRREALLPTGTFVPLNGALTALTLRPGPAWYGYGFAVSLLVGWHGPCTCRTGSLTAWSTKPTCPSEGAALMALA